LQDVKKKDPQQDLQDLSDKLDIAQKKSNEQMPWEN